MDFQKGDIIIRNETVWISQRLLTDVSGVGEGYLWKKARPSYKSAVPASCHHHATMPLMEGKSWRYAKMKGSFYYDLSTIPNRKPTYYRNYFGDADILVSDYQEFIKTKASNTFQRQFKQYIKDYHELYLEYEEYRYHTKSQQTALCKACAALEFAIQYCMDHPELSRRKVAKKTGKLINLYNMPYIPGSTKRLLEKIDQHLDEGTPIAAMIYLPRVGNSNAELDIPEKVKAWTIQLRMMGQNYSNEFIIRKVWQLCGLHTIKKPSRRWFGQQVFEKEKIKALTAAGRFGKDTGRADKYETYTPMANAMFAGECWMMDATRLNIVAHETKETYIDKKGNERERIIKKHLFLLAVRDVYSGDILGYHFSYSENRWAWMSCLKMAVENTGYLPYELVTDRFPGHNTDEFTTLFAHFKKMGMKVTLTHNARGKSKLERFWRTLQSVFMMESDYFYGEGIQSTSLANHVSPEHLNSIEKRVHKEGWGLAQAYSEGSKVVEAFRNTKYSYYSRKMRSIDKTPMQLHQESDKPNVKWISPAKISVLFDMSKRVRLSNNGQIYTEIDKTPHYYRIDDFELAATVKEVIMTYDLNDLRTVYLWKMVNEMPVLLAEAYEFDPVQPYGPQAEFNRIGQERQRQKDWEDWRDSEFEELTASAGDEVALLKGPYTDKYEKEANESVLLNQQVAGQDFAFMEIVDDYEETEINYESSVRSKY